MNQLTNVLYHITIVLKVPVIVALLFSVLWTLYEIGGFLREWRDRKKVALKWKAYVAAIPAKAAASGSPIAEFFGLKAYPTLVALFAGQARSCQHDYLHLDKLISEIEIEANKSCYRMRMWVRVAPMLGLMGTLIPMGPALMGISSGNLEAMASNLVVAFSTTVIGLMVGGMCYAMFIARRHWYAKDLCDVEYVFKHVFLAAEKR